MDDLESRRQWILERERAVARRIARRVFPAPPISAWEVIMPLFLIFNYVRRRQARDFFVLNHMVTKKLALEAAVDRVQERATSEEIRQRFEQETTRILQQDLGDVYADSIRQRQIEEMELLVETYLELLGAGGDDFADLVRDAFREEREYREFVDRLIEAEINVMYAARDFLGERSDAAFVESMVAATRAVRTEEALRVFE